MYETQTKDNEGVFGHVKARGAPGGFILLHTKFHWLEPTTFLSFFNSSPLLPPTYSSISSLSLSWLSLFPLADSTFLPLIPFSTAALPLFLSLSLSYPTNCCWSRVFLCSQRNISAHSSVNNGVSLQRAPRPGRQAMNNADFSIDCLYAIESC